MDLEEIYKQVAERNKIPVKVVKRAYSQIFKMMREEISKLPLKDGTTVEEMLKMKTSFSFPYLGKMIINDYVFKKINDNYAKFKYKEN